MPADHVRDITRVLFVDIETVPCAHRWEELDPITARLFAEKTRYDQERTGRTAAELWPERAGILAEFGRIVCIGFARVVREQGRHHLHVSSFHGHDERELLLRFTQLLERHYHGQDHWLCAHNGREFDFPWIARRCIVNRVPVPHLLDTGGLKPWEVGHLDTLQLWSFGDRKNFTSLALLAHILGIPTPKDDISGKDIARVYYEEKDLERIATYCRKDVVATAQVWLRLTGREAVREDGIVVVP